MLVLFAVLALIVLVVLWGISASNRFARLAVKIEESASGIDVALTKRFDTLTKLLSICKAFTEHETELLTQLVKYRAGMSMTEKSEASNRMDELHGRINVLAEAYPQLRSSENYKQLQESVSEVEEHLQAARRIYNMNASSFNQAIVVFPASLIAHAQKLKSREFFAADEGKRQDVKMDFR